MNKILSKVLSRLPIMWVSIGLVSLIASLIFGWLIGVYVLFGIGLTITLFVFFRQIYWVITKKGDFKK